MSQIISIAGSPGAEKTALIVELLPKLGERGVAAGVIKRSDHDISLDIEGGDACCYTSAGAAEVCIASPDGIAVFRKPNEELTLEKLAAWYFAEADLALAEGYEDGGLPKILVLADCETDADEDENIIAVVSDAGVKCGAPVFRRSETGALADLIVEKFPAPKMKNDVRLRVNGETVPIKPFVKAFIGNTVKGMLASLRGGKKAERVDLRIGK